MKLLQWFESYLLGRSQRVVLNGCSSTSINVRSGVPQGSILGPLLFIIYIDQLSSLPLASKTTLQLYADDILLYSTFKPGDDLTDLQSDINTISLTVRHLGLNLNTVKPKLLVISYITIHNFGMVTAVKTCIKIVVFHIKLFGG